MKDSVPSDSSDFSQSSNVLPGSSVALPRFRGVCCCCNSCLSLAISACAASAAAYESRDGGWLLVPVDDPVSNDPGRNARPLAVPSGIG